MSYTCDGITHAMYPGLRWCDDERVNLTRGYALGLVTVCGALIEKQTAGVDIDMLRRTHKDVPTRPVTCVECLAWSVR